MKSGVAFIVGAAFALAVPALAQTQGQFTQLVQYVGKIATRLEAERVRSNALAAYLRDMTCKFNQTNTSLAEVAKATDAKPVPITLVTGKNCALTGPAPEIPADLQ